MDTLSVLAAGGMRAKMSALDVLANNIANTATPGFKADGEFQNIYISESAEAGGGSTRVPDVRERWTDFTQGTLNRTGNSLDVALSGTGLFAVDGPGGAMLTRGGSLRVGTSGLLETAQGFPVRGSDGKPIRVDASQPIAVARDGTVTQSGATAGRIGVFEVDKPSELEKTGQGYFRLSDVSRLRQAPAATQVMQGSLEAANVSPAEASVRLVSILRQFEMLQKAVSVGSEMNKKAVDEVARVSA